MGKRKTMKHKGGAALNANANLNGVLNLNDVVNLNGVVNLNAKLSTRSREVDLTLINRIKISKTSNTDFYKLQTKKCDYIIKDTNNSNYLMVIHNGKNYLFSLNKKDEGYILFSDKQVKDRLSQFKSENNLKESFKKEKVFIFQTGKCIVYPLYKEAKLKLEELNVILRKKCDLFLSLDHVFNLPLSRNGGVVESFSVIPSTDDLLLCLHNETGCISSLLLEFDKQGKLEISCKTGDSYLKRGYNSLLIYVLLILARQIDPAIEDIKYVAVNPFLMKTIVNTFERTILIPSQERLNKPFIDFVEANASSKKELKTIMGEYLDQFKNNPASFRGMIFYQSITDTTSSEYEEELNRFIDTIKCD